MRLLPLLILLISLLALSSAAEEAEEPPKKQSEDSSWWQGFKARLKRVLRRWREDVKGLWDEVLAKADDLKDWTSEMFDALKTKLKEWVESRDELPDDEKNEIETFIEKLKVPTEKPKTIDP